MSQQARPPLLRRGIAPGGSFKRRSLKLRRGTKEGKDMEAECMSFQFKENISQICYL